MTYDRPASSVGVVAETVSMVTEAVSYVKAHLTTAKRLSASDQPDAIAIFIAVIHHGMTVERSCLGWPNCLPSPSHEMRPNSHRGLNTV